MRSTRRDIIARYLDMCRMMRWKPSLRGLVDMMRSISRAKRAA